MRIKNLVFGLAALFVYLFTFVVVFQPNDIGREVEAIPSVDYTVVIDAGHGGIDGGAEGVSTKVRESDINLALSQSLKTLLERGGINVVMTRTSSAGLYGLPVAGFKKRDMKRRAEIIADCSPTLVVSIHQNTCGQQSRRGSLVYYRYGDQKGLDFAKNICNSINKMEQNVRDCLPMSGDFYILNNSACTSVIVECGFLSNVEDEKQLCSEEYREQFAYAVYMGVIEYLLN